MRLRRGRLLSALRSDEIAPTLVTFPLMGVGSFVSPEAPPGGEASQSEFVPDTCHLERRFLLFMFLFVFLCFFFLFVFFSM